MCQCDPNIKTMWCGRGDCVPPPQIEDEKLKLIFNLKVKNCDEQFSSELPVGVLVQQEVMFDVKLDDLNQGKINTVLLAKSILEMQFEFVEKHIQVDVIIPDELKNIDTAKHALNAEVDNNNV